MQNFFSTSQNVKQIYLDLRKNEGYLNHINDKRWTIRKSMGEAFRKLQF